MTGKYVIGSRCCLLAIVFVISPLIQVGDAQAYHFSKGWMPGRKRSDPAQLLTGQQGPPGSKNGDQDWQSAAADVCAIGPRSYRLAIDMLKVRY